MSEQGWQHFLAAGDLDDWVVLHGGAVAAYRTGSLAEGADLVVAVAAVRGAADADVVVTVHAAHVTVRLTRDLWDLEPRHVELARAVSATARDLGVGADRALVQEVQVAVSARPDEVDLGFWTAVLGYAPAAEDNAVDPLGHGSTVWMQPLDPAKPLRHAMHLDVSVSRDLAEQRLEAALAAGGRVVDDSEAPGTWILSDRAGNRVCLASWPDGAVAGPEADTGTGTDTGPVTGTVPG